MISRKHRTNTSSVETLQQAGFSASKGINEEGSILATDTVLHLKNLDIEPDGSLVLRKPIKFLRVFPTVLDSNPIKIIPTVNDCTLLIYPYGYIAVLGPDNLTRPIELEYVNCSTFVDVTISTSAFTEATCRTPDVVCGSAYKLPFLNFNSCTSSNLTTSTLIYNVQVEYSHEIFKTEDALKSTLVDESLFNESTSTICRAIAVYVKPEVPDTFYVKIYPTEPASISFAQDLALDPNLYADEAYALRDDYKQSMTSVKSILFYGNVLKSNDAVELNDAYGDTRDMIVHGDAIKICPEVTKEEITAYLYDLSHNKYVENLKIFGSTRYNVFKLYIYLDREYKIAHTIRSGKSFFELPLTFISYFEDKTVWRIDSFGVPQIDSNKIINATYKDLGNMFGSFAADLMDATLDPPQVTAHSSRLECNCFVNINFNTTNSSLIDYFTLDVEDPSSGRTVPQVIHDYLLPERWASAKDYVRNFIPSAFIECTLTSMEPSGFFEHSTTDPNDVQYEYKVRSATWSDDNYFYISFLRYTVYQETIVSPQKSLTLRFTRSKGSESSNFQFGIENLVLQGTPSQTISYSR